MRVFVMGGSPRYGSNTDILLTELIKGAESKGAVTSFMRVAELQFMQCTHCDACVAYGMCPYQDDMQKIYKELELADVIVIGAPLHFMGLPSQMKAVIDRAQCLWVKKYVLKKPPLGDTRERKGFFVSVGGRTGEHLFDGAEATVKSFFVSLDIKYAGMLAYPGVEKRASVLDHPEMKQSAFLAGQKLVEAGATTVAPPI